MSLIGLANKVFRENYVREMDNVKTPPHDYKGYTEYVETLYGNVRTYGGYGKCASTGGVWEPAGGISYEERVVNTNDGIRVKCGYCQRYGPSNEYECRNCGAPT